AHAGRNGPLAGELEQADFAGGAGVRTPAEFGGEAVGEADDADAVAVFFAEKRHGTEFADGDVDRHVFKRFHLRVFEDFTIDNVFDFLKLFVGDLREVGEIEAQAIGRYQRPGLLDVRAEVIAPNAIAANAVHNGVHAVADGEGLLEHGLVRAHALHGKHAADDFGNGGVAVRRREPAKVAYLAAGVAVEAGVIE